MAHIKTIPRDRIVGLETHAYMRPWPVPFVNHLSYLEVEVWSNLGLLA